MGLVFIEISRYSWTSTEIEECQGASLLLAADVIYSDDLTDAFFGTLEQLMPVGSDKVTVTMVEYPTDGLANISS